IIAQTPFPKGLRVESAPRQEVHPPMSQTLEILFWLGVFVALYSYLIYPLLLTLLQRKRAPRAANPDLPPMTVIITARNEERRIAEKLENTLALEYPRHLLEIIVASDASTDATDEIVGRFADRNVRLARSPERKGKEAAQGLAIRESRNALLVFTDTATRLHPDALQLLAEDFADPQVGAVSSEDELVSPHGEVRGEGAYVRYEMWLRSLESNVAGLVGLSGSCFAVRKSVCDRWRTDTPSDITVALLCSQAGLLAITDGRVKGMYQDLKDESKEFERKKRTIIRGMTAVWELRESLHPRNGLFALQVWSHKIFRWLVPIGMLLALATSSALAGDSALYRFFVIVQLAAYAAAACAYLSVTARRMMPLRIALFFFVANIATAAAMWDFLRGVRIVTWNPSQR
ncbi:MAG TPA: glycosyltransferase, partial [Steroidobacteraceae bacterium]